MKDLNKLLINKINIKNKNNFALIIGLTPSKGARSPALWNSAYKFLKKQKCFLLMLKRLIWENFVIT